MPSEDALIARSRQGSIDAFSDLVLLHQARVRSYIGRYVGARDAVDDLAQEAFLAAFRTLSAYRDEHGFALWLLGIARHRALHFLRAERHRRARDGDAWEAQIAEWQAAAVEADAQELERREHERAALLRCLKQLPARSAALVRDHYLDGVPQKELSSRLGISDGALRMAILRVRDRLRACIEQRIRTAEPRP
jgi:RNA polymerase sigma-70 factor (ECF subfamily)